MIARAQALICFLAGIALLLNGCGTEIGNGISFPDPDQGAKTKQRTQSAESPSPASAKDEDYDEDWDEMGGSLPEAVVGSDSPSESDPNTLQELIVPPLAQRPDGAEAALDVFAILAPCSGVVDYLGNDKVTISKGGTVILSASRSGESWLIDDADGTTQHTIAGDTVTSISGDIFEFDYMCSEVDGSGYRLAVENAFVQYRINKTVNNGTLTQIYVIDATNSAAVSLEITTE